MNWRKLILPGVLVLGAAALYSFRFSLFLLSMTPVIDFDPADAPPAPDYKDLRFWAMHPAKDPPRPDAELQVFWLHPTSYRSPFHWNEPLGDAAATERFQWTKDNQASIFSSCCQVFAPHYRQATLASYWRTGPGFPARDLAYADVLRAFDHFLANDNQGRPFVLAGHSQGTEHGLRLLRDRILGTPLQERLVAAYMVGIPIERSQLQKTDPEISICENPADYGCLVAWSTFKSTASAQKFLKQAVWHDESGFHGVSGNFVCVNPISWTTDDRTTELTQHQGAHLSRQPDLKIRAHCDQGILRIDDVDAYVDFSLGGNYHIYDYTLFYQDIEKNVRTRWEAYRAFRRPHG